MRKEQNTDNKHSISYNKETKHKYFTQHGFSFVKFVKLPKYSTVMRTDQYLLQMVKQNHYKNQIVNLLY